jgi:hypothetical protein
VGFSRGRLRDDRHSRFPDGRGAALQLALRAIGVAAMRLGHVFGPGREVAGFVAEKMRGLQLPLVVNLDELLADAHIKGLADEFVGHQVQTLVDFDVVIHMHLGALPLAIGVSLLGQGSQVRPFFGQSRVAITLALAERSLVELHPSGGGGEVELGQTAEGLIAQRRQHALFNDAHRVLDLGRII